MAKFIITGGAGFIGSHVVEALVYQGHSVLVIDNLLTGKKENIERVLDKIEFIQDSIENKDLLEREFEKADYIIHLAALPSVPRSLRQPIVSDKININGTLTVFESAKKTGKKVVFASSSSVYGNIKDLPKRETSENKPLSFYALQKLTTEKYAALYNQLFNTNFVGLRFFNVFGPRQDPNSEYAAVIPKFIKMINDDKIPTIYGDGETSRDFTYVKNVVSALILACENDSEHKIFNIATGSRITLNELVEKINNITGKNIVPFYEKERDGDVKHSLADISLARQELGYAPKYSFDDGLSATAHAVMRQKELKIGNP